MEAVKNRGASLWRSFCAVLKVGLFGASIGFCTFVTYMNHRADGGSLETYFWLSLAVGILTVIGWVVSMFFPDAKMEEIASRWTTFCVIFAVMTALCFGWAVQNLNPFYDVPEGKVRVSIAGQVFFPGEMAPRTLLSLTSTTIDIRSDTKGHRYLMIPIGVTSVPTVFVRVTTKTTFNVHSDAFRTRVRWQADDIWNAEQNFWTSYEQELLEPLLTQAVGKALSQGEPFDETTLKMRLGKILDNGNSTPMIQKLALTDVSIVNVLAHNP